MLDILIFNVELGQCIFAYPREDSTYTLMIDCGNTSNFEPVNFLTAKNLLTFDSTLQKHVLFELTLTNYDQDHFSGLPYLRSKVHIHSTKFPKNLTSAEIRALKPVRTEAIDEVTYLLDTYTSQIPVYNPPYSRECFYLSKADFPNESIDTNKLSQIVFLTYNGTRICIPGDITSPAWDKHLSNPSIRTFLSGTDILVASHHGREDGYNEKTFAYCKPEVIILSDKDIVHTTQEGQTQLYGSKVQGNGIVLNGNSASPRKTLTTRSDGHIWIRIEDNQSRTYRTFTI